MRIALWNINGFNNKKLELSNLIEKEKIDVICLNETKNTRDINVMDFNEQINATEGN